MCNKGDLELQKAEALVAELKKRKEPKQAVQKLAKDQELESLWKLVSFLHPPADKVAKKPRSRPLGSTGQADQENAAACGQNKGVT